jgi:ribonuclease HI
VLATSRGEELVRAGAYYGQGFTNNEAKAYALKDALECLEFLKARNPALELLVRIWGDSQLLIKHLLGTFKKPSKVRIYEAVQAAREMKKRVKRVSYRHTKRDLNKVPDDMARRALGEKGTVIYWDGDVPADAPPN